MRVANTIAALCVALLGITTIGLARQLPYDAEYGPGAGFLPFWLGVTLALLSVFLLRDAWKRPAPNDAVASGETSGSATFFDFTPGALTPWLIFLGSAVLVSVFFEHLGFALSIGLFMLITMRWTARQSWLWSIALALITPIVFYLVFVTFLMVPLQLEPAGF